MRKPNDMLFKQSDAERLLRAHLALGVPVTIEVGPDGSLRAIPLKPMAAEERPKAVAVVPGLRDWNE